MILAIYSDEGGCVVNGEVIVGSAFYRRAARTLNKSVEEVRTMSIRPISLGHPPTTLSNVPFLVELYLDVS